ncbi:MAG: radical SAM protein [Planctomycetota bacterium]|nr:radical SAM protein [Planctomycetota bacterium]
MRPQKPTNSLANYIGATSMGSFASVGDRTIAEPTHMRARTYLALEIGEACQLKCRHCIYHRPKSSNPKPNAEVLTQVSQSLGPRFDPDWVTLAGKEPTLFPEQLLMTARQVFKPDRTSILMTNGLLLTNDLLKELAGVIDVFDISVDGTKQAHDWMRGPGTYKQTWDRIRFIAANYPNRIGIIATAVHSNTLSGHPQYIDLLDLASEIGTSFSNEGRVVLTISLYFGRPDDPMRLTIDDLLNIITGLRAADCPSRVLITSAYSHLWPAVARELKIRTKNVEFDESMGLPLVKLGNVTLILFNLTDVPQISIRVSNDGLIYLGCNHLVLGDRAEDYAIASLADSSFIDVVGGLVDGTNPVFEKFRDTPEDCLACEDFDLCRAGDRVAGMYFGGSCVDPYCPLISRQ